MSKRNEEIKKGLAELMVAAYELNRKDFSVFVNFSGHVNNVSVYYHAGGWCEANPQTERFDCYTSGGLYKKGRIRSVIKKLYAASENNKEEQLKAEKIKNQKIIDDYKRLKKEAAKIRKKLKGE